MARTSLRASSLGAELRINASGSEDTLQSFIDHEFWPRFVPNVELKVDSLRRDSDLSIAIDPKENWSFDTVNHDLTCSPDTILHAICTAGYMLEAKRQALGLYTLHGNIIARNDDIVALVGPISGIGKTGLSSRAVDRGWEWISDEKFVMNDQGEYVGSIKGVLQDEKTKRSSDGNEPVAISCGGRKVGTFVVPIITDTQTMAVHTYDQEKAFWHLSEELSRDVRMTPFALDGPEVPLPSFDSEDLAIKRRRVAAKLSGLIPYLSIMGDKDSVLNYLSASIR